MHVNRGMLGWGVFFIALGAVPLAVRGGALDSATASRAWELWPLLLIGAGLGLALRNTPLVALGNISVGLAFGLMAGGLVVGGIGTSPLSFCGTGSGGQSGGPGSTRSGTLTDGAILDLQIDCGRLTAETGSGGQWSIGWADRAPAPEINASDTALHALMGNQHGLAVGSPDAVYTATLPGSMHDVSLTVNAGSARITAASGQLQSASASVNAGDARLSLTGSTGLQSLDASVNAGSLTIDLPAPSGALSGSLSANAGSLRFCTPANVPLQIHMAGEPLASNNFAQRGLARNGDTWTRGLPGVGGAQIELTVSASLGSITLDPENGCG